MLCPYPWCHDLPLEHRSVGCIIACHKTCLTLELSNDRTNLDLDLTTVRVTLNFGELRTWQAWRNALEVGENYPCVIDWHVDNEFVIQIHYTVLRDSTMSLLACSRSSIVSMSIADPVQDTSLTS